MIAIDGVREQAGQRRPCRIERGYRFEQRRDVERDLAVGVVEQARPAREQQHGEHVVDVARHADDIRPDRGLAIPVPAVVHRFEHPERPLAGGFEHVGRRFVAGQRIPQALDALRGRACVPARLSKGAADDLPVHLGVLAYVECREMQPERPHATQEAADEEQPGMTAAIGLEAVHDDLQVVGQLIDALVLARAVVIRGSQPLRNLAEQHAVRHLVVAGRRARPRGRHHRLVVLDAIAQGLRDIRRAPPALTQLLGEALRLEEVAIDDQRVMAGTALADRLGVHVRQSVHVAANPRAEMQQFRDLRIPCFVAENDHQRFLDLFVEDRDDVVDDFDEKEEHVLALVGDRQLFARVVRGLPAGREFAAHAFQRVAALDRRQ